MSQVRLIHTDSYPGEHRYLVKRDDETIDEFVSSKKLRRDAMKDISDLYSSSLDGLLQP